MKLIEFHPEVVDVTPANGTTLFKGKEIELKFSEYVDKRTFKDAVFISPALEKGFEVEWSGKTATIIFNEELKPDVTYNITIGTSVIDLNNSNNMAKAYSYAISTGDVLDKGPFRAEFMTKTQTRFLYLLTGLGIPKIRS
ncbi:MAG: Ig-like domain-containing protein [Ignavibacteriales bacterium]|nr:Ig-like domain-containing protein [Ignavibacteriales bacterium]